MMDVQQFYDALHGNLDKLLAFLRSKPVEELLKAAHDGIENAPVLSALKAKIVTHEERERKGEERETALKEEVAKLRAEVKRLAEDLMKAHREVDELSDHPVIKARKAAKIKAQMSELGKALMALEPEPADDENVQVEHSDEKPEEKPKKKKG